MQLRQLCAEVDERLGSGEPPTLLSVSQTKGVVPRSELTDNEPRADEFSKYKLCRPGDIVLNRFNAYRGSLGLARQIGIVSPDYLVLRPTHLASPEYIVYLLLSSTMADSMKAAMGGLGAADPDASGFSRIDAKALARTDIPDLTKAEQDAIVIRLEIETAKIDSLASTASVLIDRLKERRQALISQEVFGDFAR